MAGNRTGGLFSSEESQQHIYILELKAALFGLKALCNNFPNIHIFIQLDSTSAVAAINKMGCARLIDIDQVVHLIWNFVLKHDNWVTATHIPGIFNEEADIESRKHETRTEQMINLKYFEKIIKSLNFKPTVDLFAARLNTELPHFISLRPGPDSKQVSVFTFSEENLSFYAFPPFICIPKVLQKVWHDKAEGILVVPDWPNQLWYTQYTDMIIKEITLPSRPGLLTLPSQTNIRHPMHSSRQLRAAITSGKQK